MRTCERHGLRAKWGASHGSPHLRPAALLLALLLPLAACQLALPGSDRPAGPATPTATDGTITTTPLDAPAPTAAADPSAIPAPPGATTPTAPIPEPLPEPVATPAPKSEAQLSCEDDGGTWARAGAGGGMACIYSTRDGGQRCDAKDDCDGECLARSRTCSPIKPLFGCNAVLMDNGAEVTLCLD